MQGSILLNDCQDCTIIVSAHQVSEAIDCVIESPQTKVLQFRMHTTTRTNVYLTISSNPVIEKCTNIGFGTPPSAVDGETADNMDDVSTISCSRLVMFLYVLPANGWRAVQCTRLRLDGHFSLAELVSYRFREFPVATDGVQRQPRVCSGVASPATINGITPLVGIQSPDVPTL